MRVRRWAERFIIVLLVGLFGTMGTLYWRLGSVAEDITTKAEQRIAALEKNLETWSVQLHIVQARQDEIRRQLPVLEGRVHDIEREIK